MYLFFVLDYKNYEDVSQIHPLAKLVRTLYLLREVKIKGTDAQSYPTVVVVRMRDHATHLNMHVQ